MAVPMSNRSTNDVGFVHYGGVVRSGAQSGRGVELGVNQSTAATDAVTIIPTGDDDNIPLVLVGKGTGSVRVGNSSQTVQFGNSTSPLAGIVRGISTTRPPELAALGTDVSTMTIAGISTSDILILEGPVSSFSTNYVISHSFISSASEVKIQYYNTLNSSQSSTEIRMRYAYLKF